MDASSEDNFISYLSASMTVSGAPYWHIGGQHIYGNKEPELVVSFIQHGIAREKTALLNFRRSLIEGEGEKFIFEEGGNFYIDTGKIREIFPDLFVHSWMKGRIKALYEYYVNKDEQLLTTSFSPQPKTYISLSISKREIRESMPKRIFLSHKSANKPYIREFFKTLLQLGLEPWIDEEDMHAGAKLERALLKGMQDSCAAIFFITPEYKDEMYLETEVDYAIRQKRTRGEEFSIITLQMKSEEGVAGTVPELLKDYVWKTIEYGEDLKALREILKALPFDARIIV